MQTSERGRWERDEDRDQGPGKEHFLPIVQRPAEPEAPVRSTEPRGPAEGPKTRKVIEAPMLVDGGAEQAIGDTGEIRIKAQPSADGQACSFMTNRMLCRGFSWWFDGASAAEDCPLAATIFALPNIDSILLDGSSLAINLRTDARVQ